MQFSIESRITAFQQNYIEKREAGKLVFHFQDITDSIGNICAGDLKNNL